MENINYRITYLEETLDIETSDEGTDIEIRTLNSGVSSYYYENEHEAIDALKFDLNNRFVITEIEKFKGDEKAGATLFDEGTSIYEMKYR